MTSSDIDRPRAVTPIAAEAAGNGGLAARQAVVRWALRLFRREWRQQALVLALLTVVVAAAIGFSSATYNTVGVPDNATFGSANHRYVVEEPDLRTLRADVAALAERFGSVDVIGQWSGAVPGSVDGVEYRAHDPNGPFSSRMLALRDGRYPAAIDEVALTDDVAATLQLAIGDVLALDGRRRQVVGVVENPSDLNAEFVLTAPDALDEVESVTVLIGGTGSFDEVRAIRDFGVEHLPNGDVVTRAGVESNTQQAAAVIGVAQVMLVLVAMVASAGFVAVAQRRLRQLGMLGAIGAPEALLRLVVVANGAVVGATAAVVGGVLGTVGWIAVAPRMESAVGFRIDPWNLPWVLVAVIMAAAALTSTAAAWWPARMVTRVSITAALSGRAPAPRPVRRSATLAIVLVSVGLVSLMAADPSDTLVVGFGTLATVGGVLVLSPLAITAVAELSRPLPVAVRLALRDLSRYRARSGVALASVSLALGVPIAIVVAASAAEASAEIGNLAPEQLLVWTRDPSQPDGVSPFYTEDPNDSGFAPYLPELTTGDLPRMREAIVDAAAEIDATVTALEVASDPNVPADPDGRLAVTLARQTAVGYLDVTPLFRATPELLAPYGLALDDVTAGTGIVTTAPSGPPDIVTNTTDLWIANTSTRPELVTDTDQITATYTSLPASFITPDALRQNGWTTATVGWLLRSDTPFTDTQIAQLRDTAADNGLLIEHRRERESLTALRWGATTTGVIVALAVLAMTIGIIRAEAAPDLRVLTATGATSTIRRSLTSATAAGLAILGALLGTVGAYATITAGYIDDTSTLTPIPVGPLATIVIGVPFAAATTGWIVAGRQPPNLSREPLE